MDSPIADHIAALRRRMDEAAQASLLGRKDARLVAVSKGQPVEGIIAALEAGQREFGENRVQEAAAKWPELRRSYPGVTLHLIGHLQSNKAKEAVALFDVIQTLDRPSLAHALAEEMAAANRRLPCFIQVNTGEEPQKSGVMPMEAGEFIRHCREGLALDVVGLMCIPPAEDAPAPHFGLLRELALKHGLTQLSMGMSGDFETAVRFGASHVRIGTAVFGERRAPSL